MPEPKTITQKEFAEAQKNSQAETKRQIVVCNRCGATLFEGTQKELAEKAAGKPFLELQCSNTKFQDPRDPREALIVNDKGEKEKVLVAREAGCSQKVTVSVARE